MPRRLRAVIPPTRIPHALKESRRVPVDEVHVATNCFVEELEDAKPRMPARHGGEHVGKVLDEGEDHGCVLGVILAMIEMPQYSR